MPSFDIVSEISTAELQNAVDNTNREIANRFDFRNTDSKVTLEDLTVKLQSESDFQVRQLEEMFTNHCTKRQISLLGTEKSDKPIHSGKTYSLNILFKQGINQNDAKEIVKIIKESKLKVQTAIQGDKIRVNGKKIDDLQQTISAIKEAKLKLTLQFENFRD